MFFIWLTICLFIIGTFGMFLVRKHIIIILIPFEILLLAINMNFIIFSILSDDLLGQMYALLMLTIAAAESVISLAIMISYYRLRGGIAIDLIVLLKA